jgi:hypothetical protein
VQEILARKRLQQLARCRIEPERHAMKSASFESPVLPP